jgi:hypothetical protein
MRGDRPIDQPPDPRAVLGRRRAGPPAEGLQGLSGPLQADRSGGRPCRRAASAITPRIRLYTSRCAHKHRLGMPRHPHRKGRAGHRLGHLHRLTTRLEPGTAVQREYEEGNGDGGERGRDLTDPPSLVRTWRSRPTGRSWRRRATGETSRSGMCPRGRGGGRSRCPTPGSGCSRSRPTARRWPPGASTRRSGCERRSARPLSFLAGGFKLGPPRARGSIASRDGCQ